MNELEKIPTCELAEELSKREGVEATRIDPYEPYTLVIEGPCHIIMITD